MDTQLYRILRGAGFGLLLLFFNHPAIAVETTTAFSLSKIETEGDHKKVTLKSNTSPLEILIIDDGFSDPSHIFPSLTANSDLSSFDWKPKVAHRNYRAWRIGAVDSAEKQQLPIDLITNNATPSLSQSLDLHADINNYHFSLQFDPEIVTVGNAVLGNIKVFDAEKNPVSVLEPIAGHFGYILFFYTDYQTASTIVPIGSQSNSDAERGGPVFFFSLTPAKSGFLKIFLQVKINGEEIFAPFGINVT